MEKDSDGGDSNDDLDLMDEEEAAMVAAAAANPVKEEPEGECIERIMGERQGRIAGKRHSLCCLEIL